MTVTFDAFVMTSNELVALMTGVPMSGPPPVLINRGTGASARCSPTRISGKHQARSIAELVEQVGERPNAAARRDQRRRSRRVSGPWDDPANANEHRLAPQPDSEPSPEHQPPGDTHEQSDRT